MLAIIAAVAANNCIGINNTLPWHLPEDLEHFKKLTTKKIVIMGRKTWDSLPEKFRPLPNRKNIIISRQTNLPVPPGVEVWTGLEEVIKKYQGQEAFIIGGASLYAQALPLVSRLYITHVKKSVDGDVFFPTIEPSLWQEVEREEHPDFSFVTYQKYV
ncbi:MAG TPA: dihydrofolate reductase [Patescibacteria group bacterium]|nr:dihydrofolate reductase [Patescibacteria group bacterium]